MRKYIIICILLLILIGCKGPKVSKPSDNEVIIDIQTEVTLESTNPKTSETDSESSDIQVGDKESEVYFDTEEPNDDDLIYIYNDNNNPELGGVKFNLQSLRSFSPICEEGGWRRIDYFELSNGTKRIKYDYELDILAYKDGQGHSTNLESNVDVECINYCDGKLIYVIGLHVYEMDLETKEKIFIFNLPESTNLIFKLDGFYYYQTDNDDGLVKLSADGKEIDSIQIVLETYSINCLTDGQWIYYYSEGIIYRMDSNFENSATLYIDKGSNNCKFIQDNMFFSGEYTLLYPYDLNQEKDDPGQSHFAVGETAEYEDFYNFYDFDVYNNELYYMSPDNDIDGQVFKCDQSFGNPQLMIKEQVSDIEISGNTMFYIDAKDSFSLCRFDLISEEKTKLFIGCCQPTLQGNYLYYNNLLDSCNLYRMDINTFITEKVFAKAVTLYQEFDGKLFYQNPEDGNKAYMYNPENVSLTKISEDSVNYFEVDDNQLFLTLTIDPGAIFQWNKDLKKLDFYTFSDGFDCGVMLFGKIDQKIILFCMADDGSMYWKTVPDEPQIVQGVMIDQDSVYSIQDVYYGERLYKINNKTREIELVIEDRFAGWQFDENIFYYVISSGGYEPTYIEGLDIESGKIRIIDPQVDDKNEYRIFVYNHLLYYKSYLTGEIIGYDWTKNEKTTLAGDYFCEEINDCVEGVISFEDENEVLFYYDLETGAITK